MPTTDVDDALVIVPSRSRNLLRTAGPVLLAGICGALVAGGVAP